jgi:hypothetical protein
MGIITETVNYKSRKGAKARRERSLPFRRQRGRHIFSTRGGIFLGRIAKEQSIYVCILYQVRAILQVFFWANLRKFEGSLQLHSQISNDVFFRAVADGSGLNEDDGMAPVATEYGDSPCIGRQTMCNCFPNLPILMSSPFGPSFGLVISA